MNFFCLRNADQKSLTKQRERKESITSQVNQFMSKYFNIFIFRTNYSFGIRNIQHNIIRSVPVMQQLSWTIINQHFFLRYFKQKMM